MASKLCFKLCTFDVTNTLLKFKMSVGEQYVNIGKLYGVQPDPNKISEAFLHHWKVMNSKYPNFGCHNGISSYLWWKMLVQDTFKFSDRNITESQLDAISDHLYEIYKSSTCWELASGVKPLLQKLKDENVLLGVISNFDERLDLVLSATGLRSYFDFILASYVVKVAKPRREIFDLALNKTSSLSSLDALHIGDDIALDYQAAINAGWNAILINNNLKTDSNDIVDTQNVVKNIVDLEHHLFSKFYKRT